MKRRKFLKIAGITSLTPTITKGIDILKLTNPQTENLYLELVQANDEHIPEQLEKQEMRKSNRWFGGVPDAYGIYSAGIASRFLLNLTCAYAVPESRYFRSPALIERMELAAQYLLNAQHSDGTIDLPSTNFHSPPDTGFVLERTCAALGILNRFENPALIKLKIRLKNFNINGGDALAVGGVHTPNHRWVVSMALARVNSLFPNTAYTDRIDEWLAEKIDIDPDGQFAEKSTAIYSPLTDRCLITIARLLKRPELLEPVRRNLEMTLYYIHPNGEIVTAASRRQDKYRRRSMSRYYYPYRYLALKDQNGQFTALARWIELIAKDELSTVLYHFLEEPSLKKNLPKNAALPTNYRKIFRHSNLARIRREETSATILAQNQTIFSLHKGEAVLEALRLATSFFGKGQFQGETLETKNDKFTLRQQLTGPYFQPFPKDLIPGDGNLEKMPRSLRAQSEIQELETVVSISEADTGFEITIDIHGTDDVPVAVELGFRHGGKLEGVESIPDIPDAFLLKNGFGRYDFDGNVIRFGPGQAEHTWTQLRGANPKLDALSVYLTGFTPFQTTLKIG